MPVRNHGLAKGINQTMPAQAIPDFGVLGDKLRIIEENEIVLPDWPINGKGHRCQQHGNEPLATLIHPLIQLE